MMASEAGTATARANASAEAAPIAISVHGTAKLAGRPQLAIAFLVAKVKSHPAGAPPTSPKAIPAMEVLTASPARRIARYERVAPTALSTANSRRRASALATSIATRQN